MDYSFTASPTVHDFHAILFDMDGTIIDSNTAIIHHWTEIGQELGVDPNVILASSHGRRSIDVLKDYDPSKATWDYVRKIEGLIPQRFGSEAVEIPGSRTVLSQLGPTPWAIVTSGTQPLVSGWLDIMKLTRPAVLVTAEDVLNGKPDPACYALAREKLGLDSNARVLVVEDAPAGIKAGKGAGCEVLGLVTSHNVNEVNIGEANWIIKDLRSLKILGWDDEKKVVRVEISHALVNRSN